MQHQPPPPPPQLPSPLLAEERSPAEEAEPPRGEAAPSAAAARPRPSAPGGGVGAAQPQLLQPAQALRGEAPPLRKGAEEEARRKQKKHKPKTQQQELQKASRHHHQRRRAAAAAAGDSSSRPSSARTQGGKTLGKALPPYEAAASGRTRARERRRRFEEKARKPAAQLRRQAGQGPTRNAARQGRPLARSTERTARSARQVSLPKCGENSQRRQREDRKQRLPLARFEGAQPSHSHRQAERALPASLLVRTNTTADVKLRPFFVDSTLPSVQQLPIAPCPATPTPAHRGLCGGAGACMQRYMCSVSNISHL